MNRKAIALAALAAVLLIACARDANPPPLSGRLAGLRLGAPRQFENLTIIPVFSDRPASHAELVTLDEALKNKWLAITETGGGEVPKLMLHNLSDKRIFILSGQIITGGKQDRIISGDRIIEPGRRDIDLDVFCVEAGRWTAQSEHFYTKENLGTTSLREKAQRKTGTEQSEIWGEIAKVNEANMVATDTGAYQAAYDDAKIKEAIDRFEANLKEFLDPAAVGVVIGIGGKVKSVDVFDNVKLLRHYWPLILKSSALAAVTSKEQGALSRVEAERFLAAMNDKEFTKENRSDGSRGAVYLDEKVNSSVMEDKNGYVHFSIFPVEKDAEFQRQRDLNRDLDGDRNIEQQLLNR